MEVFRFSHMPAELQAVHVALFREVSNAGALRSRLVAASQMAADAQGEAERDTVDFCFIDACRIASITHLLTAVHSALLTCAHGQLETATIHSEILYHLAPSSNILDGIKQFGLTAQTRDLVVVRVARPDLSQDGLIKHLLSIVVGKIGTVSSLGQPDLMAAAPLTKIYKLSEEEKASQRAGNQPGTVVKQLAASISLAGLSA